MNRLAPEQIERRSASFFRRLINGKTTPAQAQRRARKFVAGLLAAGLLAGCGDANTSAVGRLTGSNAAQPAQPTAPPPPTVAPIPTQPPPPTPMPAPTDAPAPIVLAIPPTQAPPPPINPQPQAVIPTPYTSPNMPNAEPYPVPATGCTKDGQGLWVCP